MRWVGSSGRRRRARKWYESYEVNGTMDVAVCAIAYIRRPIRAHRSVKLAALGIADPAHAELVDRFTTWKASRAWTATQALTRSPVFQRGWGGGGGGGAGHGSDILLDRLALCKPPSKFCQEELLAPGLVALCPQIPDLMGEVNRKVQELRKQEDLPTALDDDSLRAVVAYTMDSGEGKAGNLYFALNTALRHRKAAPAPFRAWQGFLYYLMRALDRLPAFQGIVYRGGNQGLDQTTVRRDYTPGRLIQWAAFSSTSRDLGAVRPFVKKDEGVIFKIKVVTGRDIGPYSYFAKESEVLLTPSTRFTVTSPVYEDADGYACVDLAETTGGMLTS